MNNNHHLAENIKFPSVTIIYIYNSRGPLIYHIENLADLFAGAVPRVALVPIKGSDPPTSRRGLELYLIASLEDEFQKDIGAHMPSLSLSAS